MVLITVKEYQQVLLTPNLAQTTTTKKQTTRLYDPTDNKEKKSRICNLGQRGLYRSYGALICGQHLIDLCITCGLLSTT